MSERGTDAVPSLLTELAGLGVRLRLAGGDRLEVTAPRGRLSPDLRDRIARHKAELVDWLSGHPSERPDDTGPSTIVPDDENLFVPFGPSDLQTSFLMGSREGFEHYVRPHAYAEMDFDGLDPARFEKALNHALRRRRKCLVVVRDDMLLETVRDPAPLRVQVHDLRGLSDAAAHERMHGVRTAMQRRELPLDRWPWLEAHVSLYGEGRARIHYNGNTFFGDAPAQVRFLYEVLHGYRHPGEPLPAIEPSYRDGVLALARLEDSPLGQASKRYWCERMADWPSAPDVPLVSRADSRVRSRLERRELVCPPETWAGLRKRAGSRGLSLTNTLMAAHAELIAYWSGSRHFLLNNMISHRLIPLHPQFDEVWGNFASLYPLEVDWRHDESFHHRTRRLQAQVMADVQHSYWSGVKVLQTLNQVRRSAGRAVCPFAVGSALFLGPAHRPPYSVLETPQTILDCEFWELRDGSLWVIWDVIESMFPEGLIDAMLAGYQSLITSLAESDSAWELPAFDLLPAGQREQRRRLNEMPATVPTGLLHDPLPRHAAESPDRPAVVSAGTTLTYSELGSRSDRLAGRLRAAGVGPGGIVAVALPKGWEQVVAVLGALTAGAAYVPLDPAWPADRIRYVLTETAAGAVVTSTALRAGIAAVTPTPILAVDEPGEETAATAPAPPRRQAEDLAYVIYTSGSTGRPKGAMLDHRGPLNTIIEINRRFGITSDDVVFGVSSLCFDLSVYDVFGALRAGATLVLPTERQTDPAAWIETVREHGVTVWNSVPAIMQLFVEEAAAAAAEFPALRTVLLSGDWIPVDLPDRIREIAPNARVISLGGATEASIWSICFPIDRVDPEWPSIPYGRPLAGQTWHVLDDQGRDAPTWVTGHLHIGGAGVALGYLGDPDRTASAFVAHPRTGERLYRTGDLGRYLPGGDIEFLGRADFQVKVQGYRVEPGEIEHTLLEHPEVAQAAVVARTSDSGRQLAAFVVGQDGEDPPDPAALRAFLTDRLPAYMVPGHLGVLARMPLTGNGKLDRRALEALGPVERAERRAGVAPRTPVEKALAEIWESILATGPIGVHDDFFELGGQSFAALRVIRRLVQRLGRRVPVSALMEHPTVAGLAEWLAVAERTWSPLVRLRRTPPTDPWFFVHPAGGDVLCYRALAELLDRPLSAFQAPGPACGREPLETMDQLVGLYMRALLEERPRGPYLLGGWSSGAVIAVEMAHRLERRGERVERIVVIDAPAPIGAPRETGDAETLLWFLEDLDAGLDTSGVGTDELRKLAGLPEADRLAGALDLLSGDGGRRTGLDPVDLAATFAVFQGVVRACNGYRAPEIAAPVTLVRAAHGAVSEFADHPSAASPDWGWSSLTSGTVHSVTVSGTHHTLLESENVTAVADAINAAPATPAVSAERPARHRQEDKP